MRHSLYIFLFFFVVIFGTLYAAFHFYSPNVLEGSQTITITSGEGVKEIGWKLEEAGVIRDHWWFETYIYVRRVGTKLQAGEYSFTTSSLYEVTQRLTQGVPREQMRFTLIEGWTRKQMAAYIAEQSAISEQAFLDASGAAALEGYRGEFGFLASVPTGETLEGYLYPETYDFFLDATAEDVVRKMLRTFDSEVASARFVKDVSQTGYSFHDIVIMASVVEREVRSSDDMVVVADIFWKRYEVGMRLQADSTVNYVIDGDNPSLTLEQTKLDTPYNTYLYSGLPKGPISNPGKRALQATVHPEAGPYWYFLSKPSGETVFSETLEQHNIAKNKYLK